MSAAGPPCGAAWSKPATVRSYFCFSSTQELRRASRASPGTHFFGPRSRHSGAEAELASDCDRMLRRFRSDVGDEHPSAPHGLPVHHYVIGNPGVPLLPTYTPPAITSKITSCGRRRKESVARAYYGSAAFAGHRSLLGVRILPSVEQKAFQMVVEQTGLPMYTQVCRIFQ